VKNACLGGGDAVADDAEGGEDEEGAGQLHEEHEGHPRLV
jgi:hypothetical protein